MKNSLKIVPLLLAALVLSGCGDGGTSEPTSSESPATSEPGHVHNYQFDSFVWDKTTAGAWSAKAKLVCSYDASHVNYSAANVSVVGQVDPTCVAGSRTYKAVYMSHEEQQTEVIPPVSEHSPDEHGFCSVCHAYTGQELEIDPSTGTVTNDLGVIVANKWYYFKVTGLNPNEAYRMYYEGNGTSTNPIGSSIDYHVFRKTSETTWDDNVYENALLYSDPHHIFTNPKVTVNELYFSYRAHNEEIHDWHIRFRLVTSHKINRADGELGQYGFCQGGHYFEATLDVNESVSIELDDGDHYEYRRWNVGMDAKAVWMRTVTSYDDNAVDFYVLKEDGMHELGQGGNASRSSIYNQFEGSIDGYVYAVFSTDSASASEFDSVKVDRIDEHFFAENNPLEYFGGFRPLGTLYFDDHNRRGNTWYFAVQSSDIFTEDTIKMTRSGAGLEGATIEVWQKLSEGWHKLSINNDAFTPYEDGKALYFEVTSTASSLTSCHIDIEIEHSADAMGFCGCGHYNGTDMPNIGSTEFGNLPAKDNFFSFPVTAGKHYSYVLVNIDVDEFQLFLADGTEIASSEELLAVDFTENGRIYVNIHPTTSRSGAHLNFTTH